MNEFALIDRYFRRAVRDPAVRIAIGDDGAVVAPASGCDLVFSVDMLVEGRHFVAGTDPAALGHKTLAVNLSDMAAMGAKPRWALLAGALPDSDERWLSEFARGLFGSRRRGDAAKVQTARCEGGKEIGDGGTCPQSDGHAVLDEPCRLSRRGSFLVLDCAHARISSQLMPRTSSQ